MTQTIPKVYVARFVQLVTARRFAEAERVLKRLKQKIRLNERNRGYFQALYGMLWAQRNNDDRYAFLSNLNLQDKKGLLSYRREFQRQSEFRLNAEYDRGFFSAWADYMRILSKLELPPVPIANKNKVQKETIMETAGPEPEKKAKEGKESKPEKAEEAKREIQVEEKKEDIERIDEAESVENVESRQITLLDFSK